MDTCRVCGSLDESGLHQISRMYYLTILSSLGFWHLKHFGFLKVILDSLQCYVTIKPVQKL